MTKASYPLKLPASLKQAAVDMAERDGVSLNQWITMAIAIRVGAMESAKDYLARRAVGAKPGDLSRILDKVPSGPVVPGDELPEDFKPYGVTKTAAE
ncbi:pilus assembly protein HicB [Rhizobium sp.]